MRTFIFSKSGEKYFQKLSSQDQKNCITKLQFFKESDTFDHNLKITQNLLPVTHRLRVGNIRMLVRKIDDETIEILKVWYRGDIYK